MAEHADAEQLDEPEAVELPDSAPEPADSAPEVLAPESRLRRLGSRIPLVLAVGVALVFALGGLVGWLWWHSHQAEQAQAQGNLYVQTARQAALDLTSISYTEADADIQRILDATTGSFRDDFQHRAQPFVDVVKQAKSKSEGTITSAGLESVTGNQAQVLLAVSVKTSTEAAPEGPPRNWRMRISVEKVGDGAKISNVQFVP